MLCHSTQRSNYSNAYPSGLSGWISTFCSWRRSCPHRTNHTLSDLRLNPDRSIRTHIRRNPEVCHLCFFFSIGSLVPKVRSSSGRVLLSTQRPVGLFRGRPHKCQRWSCAHPSHSNPPIIISRCHCQCFHFRRLSAGYRPGLRGYKHCTAYW